MSTPEQIKINGRALKCPHCANDTFHTRESLLNTSGMEFLDLGWLNQPAQNYICSQCGRIEWFIPKDSTSRYAPAESTECLSCNAGIPAGKTSCPACGWTYEQTAQEAP